MAGLFLPPPEFYLSTPGEPKVPFQAWLKSFTNYLTAIDGESFSDKRKIALLTHCLGTEGQRIYNTLKVSDKYLEVTKELTTVFEPKVNVAERYKFRARSQEVNESFDIFVSSLRELATKCNFGSLQDEMIRDQIIEKTCIRRIRERLLLEEKLTLEKAISLGQSIESAMRESNAISAYDTTSVEYVKHKPKQINFKSKTSKKSYENSILRKCYRCDSTSHLANSTDCPAKTVKCRKCKKSGPL